MAEGGEMDKQEIKKDPWLFELSQDQAEGEEREEQENELLALEAIYENEDLEIIGHDNSNGHLPGGIFNIPIYTPEGFNVKITKDIRILRRMTFSAVQGRGRSERIKERAARRRASLSDHSGDEGAGAERVACAAIGPNSEKAEEKLYAIKRLPPITLTFAYTQNYPTSTPPLFTLSCCWLEKKNLSRLCEKLDQLWEQHNGMPIISIWHDFLYNDVFDFLGIKSPYDLGRVLMHMFTHPVKTHENAAGDCHLKPRPFDSRGIQNFSHIDEVLPKVLDFNLSTCEVCFEEKPGVELLRLVNCEEHLHCRACMKGWLEAMISDGAVTELRCPGFKCDRPILPTEVASVVSEENYQRYDKLLLRTALDVMTDMMNCPRPFCQFPVVLEDNLGHCPKCSYAFCSRCQNTYHGHSPCKLKAELHASLCAEYETASEARKLQLEMKYGRQVIHRAVQETHSNRWLEDNSKQCPCCGTFIQKKDGCNKMTCTKCRAFFCWLCQEQLSKSTPYAHYQHPTSPCANRLFEGVANDDDEEDSEDDERLFEYLAYSDSDSDYDVDLRLL
ncbi:hypothetical protein EGW08_001975 [Elysia chlorotica]|uniref:RBR-type E3 ubiquitin transferase n=1 Tax=Elysia chlorotica TaxID=188477 RepID=A0A433U930_ELYCH|nr:hypothetical protein EGW08_001975 [Elysia chlorotica]